MNEVVTKEDIKIENMIYEIRGKQVMLDSDLARLYKCKNGTKEINQAVRNSPEKFPERFSFVLNDSEMDDLRSKILTSSLNKHGGRRYNIRVFTEQNIAKYNKQYINLTVVFDNTFHDRYFILDDEIAYHLNRRWRCKKYFNK